MSGARPGWYPDPAADPFAAGGTPQGRRCFRWWNGKDWTDAVGDSPDAPEPRRPRVVHPNVRRPVRLRTAWTLSLALVAVAGVVLGLVIWQDPGRTSPRAAAGMTARPSTTGIAGELDQSTREATIGAATMTLPPNPYALRPDPMRATGLFDSYFAAGAYVHRDYRGGRDWSAVVGLAHVAPSASLDDLEASALAVARGIAGNFFDHQPTTIADLSVSDHSVDGCSGLLVTAQVRYRIEGLPSRADELTLVVVRLDDGTKVAAFASVPTDAPAGVRAQAGASIESLHIG